MKKSTAPIHDPNVLAVAHRAGKVWRCLVASAPWGAGARGGPAAPQRGAAPPTLIAQREFPADQINRLDQWLDEHHAASLLCVLPAGAVICRNCSLPNAAPEQLAQALALQAEALLPGIAPPHRLAMAVLSAAAGETTCTGLLLAWPPSAAFTPPPTTRPITFVPDVAALAALLNGQRPPAPLLWLDRNDGSVAIAITHAGGVNFRGTRVDAESPDTWQRSIGLFVAETGLGVNHSGPYIESLVQDARAKAAALVGGPNAQASLSLPREVVSSAAARLHGAASDAGWWSGYGIAAGALLARSGPLAPLTRMLDAPPAEQPSHIKNLMQALSHPPAAAVVVVACVLVLMLGPLAFSALRLGILKLRFSDIEQARLAAVDSRSQVAIYEEMQKQNTWPVTKLLADITANTPLGIELRAIRIESGKDFSISATAITNDGRSPAQLVAAMQENLGRDGMFSDIVVNAGKSDNLGRYEFDLSAKVVKPYSSPKELAERDFAKKPYAVWLYGEAAMAKKPASQPATGALAGATNVNSNPTQLPPDEGETGGAGTENGGAAGNEEGDGTEPDNGHAAIPHPGGEGPPDAVFPGQGADGSANPRPIPPPLSKEQINAMTKSQARATLGEIAKARELPNLDAQTTARLREEWDLLFAQMRKAPE